VLALLPIIGVVFVVYLVIGVALLALKAVESGCTQVRISPEIEPPRRQGRQGTGQRILNSWRPWRLGGSNLSAGGTR
jgi:hypothetical protein